MLIEILSTGRHVSSSGSETEYTPADLQSIADAYNQSAAENRSNEKPAVIGHPDADSPAVGWVKYLNVKGNKLLAEIRDIDPEFEKDYTAGRYRNVSVSLYRDKRLRHVGFLGGAAPAVKDLSPVEFSEPAENAVISKNSDSSENAPSPIDLQAKVDALEARIAEYEKEKRASGFREYCEKAAAEIGTLPLRRAISEEFPQILEMAAALDSAAAGSAAGANQNAVRKLIERLSKIALAENFSESNKISLFETSETIKTGFEGKIVDQTQLALHKKALSMQRKNPGLSYEDAVARCTFQEPELIPDY